MKIEIPIALIFVSAFVLDFFMESLDWKSMIIGVCLTHVAYNYKEIFKIKK